jgi:hypothetical protein
VKSQVLNGQRYAPARFESRKDQMPKKEMKLTAVRLWRTVYQSEGEQKGLIIAISSNTLEVVLK